MNRLKELFRPKTLHHGITPNMMEDIDTTVSGVREKYDPEHEWLMILVIDKTGMEFMTFKSIILAMHEAFIQYERKEAPEE